MPAQLPGFVCISFWCPARQGRRAGLHWPQCSCRFRLVQARSGWGGGGEGWISEEAADWTHVKCRKANGPDCCWAVCVCLSERQIEPQRERPNMILHVRMYTTEDLLLVPLSSQLAHTTRAGRIHTNTHTHTNTQDPRERPGTCLSAAVRSHCTCLTPQNTQSHTLKYKVYRD